MEGEICQHLSLFLRKGWTGIENKLGGRQRNAISYLPIDPPANGLVVFVSHGLGLSMWAAHGTQPDASCLLGTHLEGTPVCWRLNLAFSKAAPASFLGKFLLKLPKQMDLSSNMMPA